MSARRVQVVAGPRPAPVRTIEIALSDDYEGWVATVRTNHPFRTLLDLESGDTALTLAAMAKVILRWNFVDEAGEPLPQPDEGGVALCDSGALASLMTEFRAALERLSAVPKA